MDSHLTSNSQMGLTGTQKPIQPHSYMQSSSYRQATAFIHPQCGETKTKKHAPLNNISNLTGTAITDVIASFSTHQQIPNQCKQKC